jgi:thiamine pyrophosphokinase
MNIVIIVGNGKFNDSSFSQFFDSKRHILIAADGGANHLKKLDLFPKKIIGDLDSLEDLEWWERKTEIIHVPDQHSTDIEKCLEHIEAYAYIIYGASGDRIDHTFEMLHVLKKYSEKRIVFVHETDILFALPKAWSTQLPIGTRLSLYPLEKTKAISSHGLKHPIDDLVFEQGTQIGTSNETTYENVKIVLQNPGLACILPVEFLQQIISTS